ncbi:MAG: superoxide dismutase [Haloplasmataceae bacterium]|nr:superoxide dismutase [Haloplasmataceae bacterium]
MPIFTLPNLPYSYDALEPHIDARTVEIHYDRHHRTYLNNLNASLEGNENIVTGKTIEEILANVEQVPTEIRQKVINQGGGYANHNLYWAQLSPNGGGFPTGKLAKAINEQFTDFNKFQEAVTNQAKTIFGSGYAWVVVDNASKKLEVMQTANQNSPLSVGKTPIMTIDVWEHAYYLKYQNLRPTHIDAIWKLFNWDQIGKFYEKALK